MIGMGLSEKKSCSSSSKDGREEGESGSCPRISSKALLAFFKGVAHDNSPPPLKNMLMSCAATWLPSVVPLDGPSKVASCAAVPQGVPFPMRSG